MIKFNVGVVLPSAGSGERFGVPGPKQYYKVLGKPLFLYAVREFCNLPWVKKIALVVNNPKQVKALLEESHISAEKVLIIQGENSRHRSIRAGVLSLQKCEIELKVVVIHDAVRPLVPAQLVQELVVAAEKYGGAGAIRPLVSTVLCANMDGFLEQSLDRSKHVSSETPQAFQLNTLVTAYSKCSDEELDFGTECLQLVLNHTGIRSRLIEGPPDLWKVTHKKDIYAAIGCLREKRNRVCIMAPDESEMVRLVRESLESKVSAVQFTETSRSTVQQMYNTVVLFHQHEIDQDSQLLDFAAKLDVEQQGLIIHVIEHTSTDGMQSMSVYDLHRNGRNMARQYKKLHKGVVVIHCLTPGEDQQLVELVTNLVLSDANTFSGQTLFL